MLPGFDDKWMKRIRRMALAFGHSGIVNSASLNTK
jgi:hypothetical protein